MCTDLCSPPNAQNERMGGHIAMSLPGMLLAEVAHHTARHTNQLARTAREKACGTAEDSSSMQNESVMSVFG